MCQVEIESQEYRQDAAKFDQKQP